MNRCNFTYDGRPYGEGLKAALQNGKCGAYSGRMDDRLYMMLSPISGRIQYTFSYDLARAFAFSFAMPGYSLVPSASQRVAGDQHAFLKQYFNRGK